MPGAAECLLRVAQSCIAEADNTPARYPANDPPKMRIRLEEY